MRSPRSIAVGAIVGFISLLPSLPTSAHQPEKSELGGSARRGWPVIMAAGDIAAPGEPSRGQRETAALIGRRRFTALLPLGDTQYDDGLIGDYRSSYDPTWGRFFNKTHPVPGNHEYHSDARGYFRYFGRRAHPPHGYYSFDLGRWHLIALNSSNGGRPSSRQLRWLRRDLRRNRDRCELAYWHHPRFSSGTQHGSDDDMAPFWRALHAHGVDVVLNGHEHHYERFARLLPSGRPSVNGIREFVVGTGGNSGGNPFRGDPLRGSRRRLHGLGLIRMELRASSYTWRYLRVDGTVADRGSTACHR